MMNASLSTISLQRNKTFRFNELSVLTNIVFFPADVVAIALLTAIILIGIPGNILVIIVFGLKRNKVRTRFESFLLILACVDLFSLLVVPTSFFYLTVTKFSVWHFGRLGCKLIPMMLQVSVTVTHGVLLLISFERHRAIVHPFDGRISNKTATLCMVIVVMASLILVTPYMSTFEIVRLNDTETCAPSPEKYDLLIISSILQLSRDLLCFSILARLGFRMHKALTRKIAIATWNRALMSTKGRKVLKNVIIIFMILTLPLDIFQVLYYAISLLGVNISAEIFGIVLTVNTFLNILQMSNSVVNVFIYSKLHSTFTFQICCDQKDIQNKERSRSDSIRNIEFDELFAVNEKKNLKIDSNAGCIVHRTTRKRKHAAQTIIFVDSTQEEITSFV